MRTGKGVWKYKSACVWKITYKKLLTSVFSCIFLILDFCEWGEEEDESLPDIDQSNQNGFPGVLMGWVGEC